MQVIGILADLIAGQIGWIIEHNPVAAGVTLTVAIVVLVLVLIWTLGW